MERERCLRATTVNLVANFRKGMWARELVEKADGRKDASVDALGELLYPLMPFPL